MNRTVRLPLASARAVPELIPTLTREKVSVPTPLVRSTTPTPHDALQATPTVPVAPT